MRSSVELFCQLTGASPSAFPKVPTPFGTETSSDDGLPADDTPLSAHFAASLERRSSSLPSSGDHNSPAMLAFGALLSHLHASPDPASAPASAASRDSPVAQPPTEPTGILQPISARVLMKILYGARMARHDLLRAVCHLASCVTKWTRQCDEDLFRLVSYIHHTSHFRQYSWIGDLPADLRLVLFADADFAGCIRSQRSTTGYTLMLAGSHTRAPLSACSRRQTAISKSTPEAEMIAASYALSSEGLPAMSLWDALLQRPIVLDIAEDNEATIKICRSGRSQRLAHLPRTHKVSCAFISERMDQDPNITLQVTKSEDQAADLYTKRFDNPQLRLRLLTLNNIVEPTCFWSATSLADYYARVFRHGYPTKPGGIPARRFSDTEIPTTFKDVQDRQKAKPTKMKRPKAEARPLSGPLRREPGT